MRLASLLVILTLVSFNVALRAQNPKTFYLFYVDKSRPSNSDGLNDRMLNQLSAELDETGKNEQPFVFYISNGTESQITGNKVSVPGMVKKLFAIESEYPKQYYDMRKMRKLVYEKLKDFKGNIVLNYYVSNRLCSDFSEKLSPLINFFPKELIAVLNNNKNFVTLNIYYPKTSNIINERELRAAVNFYNEKANAPKIDVVVKNFD